MSKDFKYTTIFSSTVKPLVSEEKDEYLAMASLVEVGDFIPNVDTSKNIDLLPIAFNACVANRVNKNGDVVDTKTALSIAEHFVNKPINIEHNRERVVGVILNAGFSEFGTDKILKAEEIKDLQGPFNITLGGVVWKVVSSRLADIIEEASDPTSESYLKVSASWELGFSDYNIIVLNDDDKNIANAEVISDFDKVEEVKSTLRAFGGSGKLEDGRSIYRQVINNVLPLGIGLTENPAADVKGVAIIKNTQSVKAEEKTEKIAKSCSQSAEKNVKSNKESVMDKIKSLKDITDENLQELSASAVSDFIEQELQKASEQFVAEKAEIEDKLKAARDEHQQLVDEHSKLKETFEGINNSLDELKSEVAAKEAEEKFNQRMASFDAEYELDDDHRAIIASDIKDMDDEDFESYAKKMEILLSRQKYGGNKGDMPDADRKKEGHHGKGPKRKETADEEGEVDFKKDMKASEEVEEDAQVEEVVENALDNASEATVDIPTTSDAEEPTLYDKYKGAFSLNEGFEIK